MRFLFRMLLVTLVALPLAGCGDDPKPCPFVEVDGDKAMEVHLVKTGPQKFTAQCPNGEPAKDLTVPRGDWLYMVNNLDEDITVKFKKKGMSSSEFWKLFGQNGQVDIPMGETMKLQVLPDADKETTEYGIISWTYGDPGPTIKVP